MIDYKCKKTAPCRFCEQRRAECHSTCQKYKEWLAELEAEKDMFWKAEGTNVAFKGIMSEHKAKRIRKKKREKR